MNFQSVDYQKKIGVILINVGTPQSTAVSDVRRYLREFLMDPRVITIATWLRWLLVHVLIVPLRGPKSSKAYKKIWLPEGSPLLLHSEQLVIAVQSILGEKYIVKLGMRYGQPKLENVIYELIDEKKVDEVVLAPLYPQYSSSATGSSIQKIMEIMSRRNVIPAFRIIGDFYDNEGFVSALAEIAKVKFDSFKADHVLMSYHGLPESHVKASTKNFCFSNSQCCENITMENRFCYRAQCFATSRLLAKKLGIAANNYSVSFQSRLGREPWIKPFTDVILSDLKARGIMRLAVVVPSFVSDCLETLEEIGIRAALEWKAIGGEELILIPCVNNHQNWANSLASLIRR